MLITAPAGAAAERLARGLVAQSLAACVNVVPKIASHYRWQGRMRRDKESLLVAKTRRDKLKNIVTYLKLHHPYELPEMISLTVREGLPAYLRWVADSVARGREGRR